MHIQLIVILGRLVTCGFCGNNSHNLYSLYFSTRCMQAKRKHLRPPPSFAPPLNFLMILFGLISSNLRVPRQQKQIR